MRRALLALAAAAVLAGGCGGGGGAGTTEAVPTEPAPKLPACAGAESTDAPPALPVDFPLPPGTVVTSADTPYAGQVVALGLIPADIQEAASFFGGALPEHGYEMGIGDSEGNESEAPFTGNGYRGKWRVNEIPECPAVRLTLVLIEQS